MAQHATVEFDPRPRRLLEQYVALVGGSIESRSANLVDVVLPPSEKTFFGKVLQFSVAYAPDVLDDSPSAHILVNGSELLRTLVHAIQHRGALNDHGEVAAMLEPANAMSEFPVPLGAAAIATVSSNTSMRPVGKLLARIAVHAGPMLVERLVETPLVDLQSGLELRLDSERFVSSAATSAGGVVSASPFSLDPDRSLQLLFDDLANSAQADIARIQSEAAAALASELARLNSYYERMIVEVEDGAGDDDAKDRKSAIRADRDRRRKEEEYRYTVRIDVHPVQVSQWHVPAEEVCWELRSNHNKSSTISASRLLVGDGEWHLSCPTCSATPTRVSVCTHAHTVCEACATTCSVCGEASCKSHGAATCDLGAHAICGSHALSCRVCDRSYCEQHSGRCELTDHSACSDCIVKCGRCYLSMCRTHANQSAVTAPLGQRWLCPGCTVLCEGGQDEPVGLDEVVRCASCSQHICVTHQSICAVDGAIHCSKHLRKSDRSGRLACETHRSACDDEPHSVLAIDELTKCSSCGRTVCDGHGATCSVDGNFHCSSHLLSPNSARDKRLCETHRAACHVDGEIFQLDGVVACATCSLPVCAKHGSACSVDGRVHCNSHLLPPRSARDLSLCETHRGSCHVDGAVLRLEEVISCPVCERPACAQHVAACKNCGRNVCSKDLAQTNCGTCLRLSLATDIPDSVVHAGVTANDGEPLKGGTWRLAQDAGHTVAQVDLGWSRRLVFAVRHGDSSPETVIRHSMLGSKRTR